MPKRACRDCGIVSRKVHQRWISWYNADQPPLCDDCAVVARRDDAYLRGRQDACGAAKEAWPTRPWLRDFIRRFCEGPS